MNSCRSSPDDIAELRGDFGDDPLIEAAPLRVRFIGQRPMPRTRPADQGAKSQSVPQPPFDSLARSSLRRSSSGIRVILDLSQMVAEGLELFFKFTQVLEKISLRLTGVLEKSRSFTPPREVGWK